MIPKRQMLEMASRSQLRTVSVPSCIGGLNGRDALAAMKPTDAVILDNWFCEPSFISVRKGSLTWASGLPGAVESLMAWNGPNGTHKLFAASVTGIYDISLGGVVGAAAQSGLTNARWQKAMLGTAGGNFLMLVNGADTYRTYDGSAFAVQTITGLGSYATTDFIDVDVYKQRAFFVIKGTLKYAYLAVSSIAGAASVVDLGSLFKLGGYLVSIMTWSFDSGSGLGDYIAFLTSEGEIAVYQGTDPSNANLWALVTLFRTGRPVGRRVYQRMGPDLAVITADGVIPLAKAMSADRNAPGAAITDRIQNMLNDDFQLYGANFGWQMILHPVGKKLILNVPENSNVSAHQYVMNTITGRWSRFTGWNANCFEVSSDVLYFGSDKVVKIADTGNNDDGQPILVDAQPAFSSFGNPGRIKHFKMCRPVFRATADVNANIDLNVDFENRARIGSVNTSSAGGTPWASIKWDSWKWGGAARMVKKWLSTPGMGYWACARLKLSVKDVDVAWLSTDHAFEVGGVL